MRKAFIGLRPCHEHAGHAGNGARGPVVRRPLKAGSSFHNLLDVDFDADGDGDIEDGERNLIQTDTDMGWDRKRASGIRLRQVPPRRRGRLQNGGHRPRRGRRRLRSRSDYPGRRFAFDVDGDLGIISAMVNGLADFGSRTARQFAGRRPGMGVGRSRRRCRGRVDAFR